MTKGEIEALIDEARERARHPYVWDVELLGQTITRLADALALTRGGGEDGVIEAAKIIDPDGFSGAPQPDTVSFPTPHWTWEMSQASKRHIALTKARAILALGGEVQNSNGLSQDLATTAGAVEGTKAFDSERCLWWVSWYASPSPFTLNAPWWISGARFVGPDMEEQATICAAVLGTDDDDIRAFIAAAHDDGEPVEFRFIEPRPADWTPFGDRFQRAAWMPWPPFDGGPSPSTANVKAGHDIDQETSERLEHPVATAGPDDATATGSAAEETPQLTMNDRLKAAVEAFNAMSREEQAALLLRQKEGYIRAEMSWGDEGTRIAQPVKTPPDTEHDGGEVSSFEMAALIEFAERIRDQPDTHATIGRPWIEWAKGRAWKVLSKVARPPPPRTGGE